MVSRKISNAWGIESSEIEMSGNDLMIYHRQEREGDFKLKGVL